MDTSPAATADPHPDPHGHLWEVSHHPVHSASTALHRVFDENAHDTHPPIPPRRYAFIEQAAFSREMERL